MVRPILTRWLGAFFVLSGIAAASGQPFLPPTANQSLFKPGAEDEYFVGTIGRTWTSGCFGCVRSEGYQLHEGLDIRCLQRDSHGEPVDPVLATADGSVVYINTRPSLSNYGNYIILQHQVDGISILSLYAHLREIAPGIKVGTAVKQGQPIAMMGHTANTREGISKERAHVHFELDLLLNDRFATWFKRNKPGQRNDHGVYNGHNLSGLDPRLILLASHSLGNQFNLVNFIRDQTELCRVLVLKQDFPWLKRYPQLVKANPVAAKEGIAGYEIALNYTGLPFELIPRAPSEIHGKSRYQLLSVNEEEQRKNPCRKLVSKRGSRWQLTSRGTELLDVLTY